MGKIFGTDGIRCLVNEEPLTAETTLKISKTVGYLLKSTKKINSRVIICKDTRLSGYLYEPIITAGFISMGMEVILVGAITHTCSATSNEHIEGRYWSNDYSFS